MSYVFAFIASLIYIFLKATQQLQVMHDETKRIVPTSLGMAACEVFVTVNVVRTADSFLGLALLALCLGSGAGIGCLVAMKRRRDATRRAERLAELLFPKAGW